MVWLLSPLFVGFVGSAVLELLRDPSAPRAAPRVRWNGRWITALAVCVLVLTVGVWLARFGGYLGGPVKVTSLREWLAARAR